MKEVVAKECNRGCERIMEKGVYDLQESGQEDGEEK